MKAETGRGYSDFRQGNTLKTLQMSEKLLSWRTLSLSFFVTSALLLLGQISFMRIILDPMYTTIRSFIAWVCVLSIIGLIFKGLSYIVSITEHKILDNRLKQKNYELLQNLSEAEHEVLRHVHENAGCAVWVSEYDAAVQTLLHRGVFERVGELERYEDWYKVKDDRQLCILVKISDHLTELI